MDKNIKTLTDLGFTNVRIVNEEGSIFGTCSPNVPHPVDVGKNHFSPSFRSVYVAVGPTSTYVTSNIRGEYRRYRAHKHNTYTADFNNIFAYGPTIEDALEKFAHNFRNGIYNR